MNGARIGSVLRRLSAASACICVLAAIDPAAAQDANPMSALDRAVASAEQSLRIDERQIAESRYRTVLLEGWTILGAIAASDGQLADARLAFERASASAVGSASAQRALAIVQLRLGETAPALELLTKLAATSPNDARIRLTLVQALVALDRLGEAAQELEELRPLAAGDAELTFALASGYLRVKKVESADALFTKLAAARPRPETHVLIGRAYRDAGYFPQARAAFTHALKLDPRARRAHYYLGTLALMEEGVVRLDEAIGEFRQELAIAPGDATTTLRLGMALVEARQNQEALPLLERSVKHSPGAPEAWVFLGRVQLGLKRAADAVVSFRQALELIASKNEGPGQGADDQERLRSLHYQLATALRSAGATAEADREFAEAQRLAVERTEADRDRLARYLADSPEPGTSPLLSLDLRGLETLPAAARAAAVTRARAALARSYLNLGIMHAQAGRFLRAAEQFESSAEIDPRFPQVQYSLGVAYFNAQRYDKAIPPLKQARDEQPQNADLKRMLALASLNTDDYAAAVDLLRDDPMLRSDASLQYAFGLALVRSDRADEAERIFSRVLAQNPDVPELHVLLGQAHAAQGDFDAAIASFRRALELKKDVAEANGALGVIYLRQGSLDAARDALAAEVASHPRDVRSRSTLATVLDLQGRSDEALKELRAIIAVNPNYADARYLFGKILLARGSAAEAVEHLELAARLAPEDANVHYQLGQAYQRLGRTDMAARAFETYQRLKAKARGGQQ